jgi:hypothetical protein
MVLHNAFRRCEVVVAKSVWIAIARRGGGIYPAYHRAPPDGDAPRSRVASRGTRRAPVPRASRGLALGLLLRCFEVVPVSVTSSLGVLERQIDPQLFELEFVPLEHAQPECHALGYGVALARRVIFLLMTVAVDVQADMLRESATPGAAIMWYRKYVNYPSY